MIPGVKSWSRWGRLLFILRHGATCALEGPKRYIGRTDFSLNELGAAQAEAWAECFSDIPLDVILCSNLKRSAETAAIIGRHCKLNPIVETSLREIDLGEWEGLSFEALKLCHPRAFAARGADLANFRPPGGESFGDLQQRVVGALEGILTHGPSPVLLVGHAGVNRVLLCHLLGLPLANLFRLAQDPAGLSLVVGRRSHYRLTLLNLLL